MKTLATFGRQAEGHDNYIITRVLKFEIIYVNDGSMEDNIFEFFRPSSTGLAKFPADYSLQASIAGYPGGLSGSRPRGGRNFSDEGFEILTA